MLVPHAGPSVSPLPPSENKVFYPALNGLRAVAVILVFCQHYLKPPAGYRWGWIGVSLFFVLSGFLITGILYDTRNKLNRFKVFYARRALRIFPLYYGVLIAALLLDPIFRWIPHPSQILLPLYLSNYSPFIFLHQSQRDPALMYHLVSSLPSHKLLLLGHFWSLAVEEQFYLVWPLVVFFVKDRVRLRNICAVTCVLCLAARIIGLYIIPQQFISGAILTLATPFRADSLLLGGLIALMLRGPERRYLTPTLVRGGLILFIAGFLSFDLIFRVVTGHLYAPDISGAVLSTLGGSLLNVFAALLILLLIEPRNMAVTAMKWKPLSELGTISYGFYVFHDIPHLFYMSVISRSYGAGPLAIYLVAALGFVCTAGLAYLSYRYYETPFLRLKARFLT